MVSDGEDSDNDYDEILSGDESDNVSEHTFASKDDLPSNTLPATSGLVVCSLLLVPRLGLMLVDVALLSAIAN